MMIEPSFKYIEGNSETGCFLHYFRSGVELPIAASVLREIVSVGEAPRGRGGGPSDYVGTLIRGLLWGISYGWWSSPSSLPLSAACLGDGLPYPAQAGHRTARRSF
jgi:hypothetical protein